MGTDVEAPATGFVDSWLGVLRRRWRLGAGVFLLLAILAGAVVFLSRPVHRAEASLRLGEPPPMSGVSPGSGLLGLFQLGGDPFANDLELLGSRTVAEEVVTDVALNVKIGAPRGWYRDSLVSRLSAGRDTEEAAFSVEWRDGLVAVRQTQPEDSTIGTVAPGESVAFGGVTAAFRPWREDMPRRIQVTTLPFGEAVRSTRQSIEAERTRREANVLEVTYDHTDPDVAHAVVGSALDRFIGLRTALHRRESTETVDSLRGVAETTLADLAAAEREMEAVQQRGRLIAPEAQGEAFIERYAEVQTELESARIERAGIADLLDRVREAERPGEAWSGLAAFPRFLENSTVAGQLAQLTQVQSRRAALAEQRAPESRQIQALDAEIAALDRSLRSLAGSYHEALDREIRELESRMQELDTRFTAFPTHAIEFGRRERRTLILSEVLGLAEQRLRMEQLRQALTIANVQVIDPPKLLPRPVWPRKKLGTAVGLVLAAGFGLLAMVVVERADRSVRRAAEVRAVLGAPVLAVATAENGAAPALTAREARAVLGRDGGDGRASGRVVLAAVGSESPAHELAQALRDAFAAEAAEREGAAAPGHLVHVAPAPDGFPAAAEAAAHGAPIVLIVRCGRTTRRELRRAAKLAAEAGGEIRGAVIVCDRARDARLVWS